MSPLSTLLLQSPSPSSLAAAADSCDGQHLFQWQLDGDVLPAAAVAVLEAADVDAQRPLKLRRIGVCDSSPLPAHDTVDGPMDLLSPFHLWSDQCAGASVVDDFEFGLWESPQIQPMSMLSALMPPLPLAI
jgi:hypothetical protein